MDREGVPDSAVSGVERFQVVTWSWAAITGVAEMEQAKGGSLEMTGHEASSHRLKGTDTWLLSPY